MHSNLVPFSAYLSIIYKFAVFISQRLFLYSLITFTINNGKESFHCDYRQLKHQLMVDNLGIFRYLSAINVPGLLINSGQVILYYRCESERVLSYIEAK